MLHLDAFFLSNFQGFCNQFFGVSFTHIREAWSVFDILPTKRMFREEIDVVSDNHQVTDFKVGVGTSCSIRYEEGLDAQLTHHAYRESHFLHGVAFIEMKASLHGHDVLVAQFPENQFPAVSFDG